jgi:hypothetical protein
MILGGILQQCEPPKGLNRGSGLMAAHMGGVPVFRQSLAP